MELLDAVYRGDVEGIKAAIAKGASPNQTDEHGRTPLMRRNGTDRNRYRRYSQPAPSSRRRTTMAVPRFSWPWSRATSR